jgi:predicted Rossmann-fold nucleotide-binding protein
MFNEIETVEQLRALLVARSDLKKVVVQNVDVRPVSELLVKVRAEGAVFLGCTFDVALLTHVMTTGGTVFPDLPGLEFKPYRHALYTPDELLEGYEPGNPKSLVTTTRDAKIYLQYQASKSAQGLLDALAQRLHDHAIDEALSDLLNDPARPRKVVAIMGGHAMKRGEPSYRDVARIARRLTERGFFLVSGGGPGAMEATNLGAWLAGEDEAVLDATITAMQPAPTFRDEGWLELALEARARAKNGHESLGVPTWFYGHEPSNVFSTHIAKYFSNSLREDGLLAIAHHGVVFAPGAAGTIQEIFQDAAQNHYGVFADVSPMVLFGSRYWKEEKPVWPLLTSLARGKQYESMIAVEDQIERVVSFIEAHPPLAYHAVGH